MVPDRRGRCFVGEIGMKLTSLMSPDDVDGNECKIDELNYRFAAEALISRSVSKTSSNSYTSLKSLR